MKKNLFLLFVVLLVIVTSTLISLMEDGNEDSNQKINARIDNFRYCGLTFTANNEPKIEVCGTLTSNKNYVPIIIYIYKMPEEVLVAENMINDYFASGDFSREFTISLSNNPIQYKAVAYLYRDIIGEVLFTVVYP